MRISNGLSFRYRAVGRSENPGVPVLFDGHNLSPLVEIGLTDLPRSWGNPRDNTPEVYRYFEFADK